MYRNIYHKTYDFAMHNMAKSSRLNCTSLYSNMAFKHAQEHNALASVAYHNPADSNVFTSCCVWEVTMLSMSNLSKHKFFDKFEYPLNADCPITWLNVHCTMRSFA